MPLDHPSFLHLALDAYKYEDADKGCDLERPGHLTHAWGEELNTNGRVVVYTDGASKNNGDARLRKAGFG
eukprot:924713-Karenia_brevis.AAC.1